MASLQEIKRRIKAVSNTGQITKAMEMVSATKMRKSQEIALNSRPYAMEVLRILAYLQEKTSYIPDLFITREVKHGTIVVISSDRGLAGSFNSNVFKSLEKILARVDSAAYSFIAVGKRASEFLNKKNLKAVKSFSGFGDFIEPEETKALTDFLTLGFKKGQWDEIIAVSTHFRTTLKQDVLVRQILPSSASKIRKAVEDLVPEYGRYAGMSWLQPREHVSFKNNFEYLIEPDEKSVIDALAPKLVEIIVHSIVLEANASEHSARMVAMKNASENASELKENLNLEFNKLRQAAITQEITEIVSGAN